MTTPPAERAIRAFGSQTKLARARNTRQSTISKWKESGFVPAHQQAPVLEAALEHDVRLTPDDFFPPELVRRIRERWPCDCCCGKRGDNHASNDNQEDGSCPYP